jgi:hypothetical protein
MARCTNILRDDAGIFLSSLHPANQFKDTKAQPAETAKLMQQGHNVTGALRFVHNYTHTCIVVGQRLFFGRPMAQSSSAIVSLRISIFFHQHP